MVLIFKGDLQGGKSHNNGGHAILKKGLAQVFSNFHLKMHLEFKQKRQISFYSHLHLNQEPITRKIFEDWTHRLTE